MAPSLARSASSLPDEVMVAKNGLFHLRRGGIRAVVHTGSLNFCSASAEQQQRTIRGFRDLLHAQNGPLQLCIRSERVPPMSVPHRDRDEFADDRAYLRGLTDEFIASHLAEMPVYRRTISLVLSPAPETMGAFDRILHRGARGQPRSEQPFEQPLRHRAHAAVEHLRQMGIDSRVLDDRDLSSLWGAVHAPAAGGPASALRPLPTSVTQGTRCYTTFAVDRYPGSDLEPGWLLPLLSFPAEFAIGIHIVPLDSERVVHLLHHKIRDLRADELANFDSGEAGRSSLTTLPDAELVHQAIVRNEEKAFAVSFYVTIAAESPIELRALAQSIRTACRRMMLRVTQPYFQMLQGLVATWPIGVDLVGREHLMHTAAVTTLLPWLQTELADEDGYYLGHNRDTGGLVVLDPFDEHRFPNANIAVLAHSGAGKSYAAASLALSGFTNGVGAIILDPEAEYGHLVRALHGTYLHFAAGSGHAVNILDPLRTPDPDDSNDQLTDVLDLVAMMCGGTEPVERAQLESAVRAVVAAPAGVPVLGDVCAELESRQHAPRVATILKRWTTGELGQLFSSPTNVDLTADLVGFNLRDLKDEVVGPAYLLLANWLWARLRRDRRPRHLLIDEAGLLLEHEVIRRFLVRLARRIRKYRGSLILVTQNPGDLFDSKDGAVLATNPSLLLLGTLKHSEALKVQKAFSLTDRQVASLEVARRGDFLLLAGPNRVPLHVMSPPWMDELIVQFRDRPGAAS
jgi:hypothetical protein